MKTLGSQAAFLAVLSAPLLPPTFARAESGDGASMEVAQMEEVYSESFVTFDTSVAERVVAADFVGLEPDGKTSDKSGILADFRRPDGWNVVGWLACAF